MDYTMMSDTQIIRDLAQRVDQLRIARRLKDSDIERISGLSRKTIYNFRTGKTGISLRNLIRLLQALGEVDRLQRMFPPEETYSPLNGTKKKPPKRVRGTAAPESRFRWGDER